MDDKMVLVNAEKIALLTGFKAEEVAIIKNTVAKGTTDSELAYFLSVSKSTGLNPFNKEIWCYKDNKQNVIIFAGRDGFLKKAQESPLWNGMTSFEVCANDFFEIDVTAAKVKHVPNFKDRGEIIGAYAIVRPKGCELPTIEWADFKIYNKGYNTWKTDAPAMIKKVAESHALKKAFGITVIQPEEDFDVKDGVAVPVIHKIQTDAQIEEGLNKEAAKKLVKLLDEYNGEDKELLKHEASLRVVDGTFTVEYAQSIAEKIGAII
jgi:recombinational DNA repair protein RecT